MKENWTNYTSFYYFIFNKMGHKVMRLFYAVPAFWAEKSLDVFRNVVSCLEVVEVHVELHRHRITNAGSIASFKTM